jgi:hypothetical protein
MGQVLQARATAWARYCKQGPQQGPGIASKGHNSAACSVTIWLQVHAAAISKRPNCYSRLERYRDYTSSCKVRPSFGSKPLKTSYSCILCKRGCKKLLEKLYTCGKMLTHSLLQCHHYYVIMHVIVSSCSVELYSFDSVCCD